MVAGPAASSSVGSASVRSILDEVASLSTRSSGRTMKIKKITVVDDKQDGRNSRMIHLKGVTVESVGDEMTE